MKDHPVWTHALESAFHLDDPEAARELAARGEQGRFGRDQRILECGANADHLLVILNGRVDLCLPIDLLSRDKGVRIDQVEEGAILGWSAIVNPYRYVLSAWAVEAVEAIVLTPQAILDWCEEHPAAGCRLQSKIANIVGRRLASMTRALRGEIEFSVHQGRRGAYE